MNDPYAALGVAKTAGADEIKKAYRALAKQLHPDLNPGNEAAATRFKDVSSAYDLLSDADKRGRFDRGEIDASGQERPEASFYRSYAGGPQGAKYRAGAGFDPSDLFSDLFAKGGRGAADEEFHEFRMRGSDVGYTLTVDFIDAAKGIAKRLSFPDGRTLDVNVPPGTESGQVLRLRGQGQPGIGGGPPGDALIEVTVAPHPFFRRDGNDIQVEVPVTLTEAVAGGKITVPTIEGPVSMTVPANSNSGTRLRLKGRGIAPRGGARGDQYVSLKLVLPREADSALQEFVKNWSGRDYDARGPAGMDK